MLLSKNKKLKQSTRLWRVLPILILLAVAAAGGLGGQPVLASGKDFKKVVFTAAAPLTYNHATGGGAYDSGTVGNNKDIVNQLQGANFTCGDTVTFLMAIEMDGKVKDAVQAADFDLVFLANTTGRAGAAIADVVNVKVNYGKVAGGDGPGGTDSGMRDDGGSNASLISKQLSKPLFAKDSELLATIRVTDLEAGEQVIVRIDTVLRCQPGSDPTGNLQAKLEDGRVVGSNDKIDTGKQTIPFQKLDDAAGTGEPLLQIVKTVTPASGSNTSGNACATAVKSLNIEANTMVRYCYTVTNAGTQTLFGLAAIDDNATPNDPADDFPVLFNNVELAAGSSQSAEVVVTIDRAGTLRPAVTATGNNGQSGNQYEELTDSDLVELNSQAVSNELTWSTNDFAVAYEDLKNTGWSDWDYNDFIVRMSIKTGINELGNLGQMVIDYEAMARGADFNHKFIHKLPINGGGTAELVVRNGNGAIIKQETFSFGPPATFAIFERTRDALPPLPNFFTTNTQSGQGQAVRGYTATLTLTPASPAANPASGLSRMPWDPYLYAYNSDEEIHLVIPGHLNNTQTVNAAYDPGSPLIGYDLPLAQILPAGWQWPVEFAGIWRAYPSFVTYVSGGTSIAGNDWYLPGNSAPQWLWSAGGGRQAEADFRNTAPDESLSRYFAGPVVADLDGDGANEVIVGNLMQNRVEVYGALQQRRAGWPQATGGGVKAAPVVADLDGDGSLEILAGATDGKVYAWHANGQPVAGWPALLDADFRVLASPAVGDIDGDGQPEVVVPLANGTLHALRHNGQPASLPGWPVSIGNVEDHFDSQLINSSPRIVDLDGDGTMEIVVGSTDRNVYAFSANGTAGSPTLWSYATGDMVFSTPVVADIDPVRDGLEVAFGSGDGYLYLLDSTGRLIWRASTGWTLRASPTVADLDGDGLLELLIGGDDDKVWAWRHDGRILNGWPQTTGGDVLGTIAVGDIDGDGRPEVAAGSDDARVYVWHADGRPLDGWPRPTVVAVKGSVALANLDGDAELEVAAADFNGQLYLWGVDAFRTFMPLSVNR